MENNRRTLRIRAGLTQKELAEKTGITQGKITTYEQAASLNNVTVGNLSRIATALGTTIDTIISPLPDTMKNLKRIRTEEYDCSYHFEEEPFGVKDYLLIDGKLYFSDTYEWILVNNFGVEISTDCGYDEGDLGQYPEKTLELIRYLIEDAPQKGYVEDATEEEEQKIRELLGE